MLEKPGGCVSGGMKRLGSVGWFLMMPPFPLCRKIPVSSRSLCAALKGLVGAEADDKQIPAENHSRLPKRVVSGTSHLSPHAPSHTHTLTELTGKT